MTRRVRYRVNISAQVMSAICDTKILMSSLIRCVAAIASAFFSTSATLCFRASHSVQYVSATRRYSAAFAPESIEMETNDRNPRVFLYRARIFRGVPYFRLYPSFLSQTDKSRIRKIIERKACAKNRRTTDPMISKEDL